MPWTNCGDWGKGRGGIKGYGEINGDRRRLDLW